jgi:hypothetical protein
VRVRVRVRVRVGVRVRAGERVRARARVRVRQPHLVGTQQLRERLEPARVAIPTRLG